VRDAELQKELKAVFDDNGLPSEFVWNCGEKGRKPMVYGEMVFFLQDKEIVDFLNVSERIDDEFEKYCADNSKYNPDIFDRMAFIEARPELAIDFISKRKAVGMMTEAFRGKWISSVPLEFFRNNMYRDSFVKDVLQATRINYFYYVCLTEMKKGNFEPYDEYIELMNGLSRAFPMLYYYHSFNRGTFEVFLNSMKILPVEHRGEFLDRMKNLMDTDSPTPQQLIRIERIYFLDDFEVLREKNYTIQNYNYDSVINLMEDIFEEVVVDRSPDFRRIFQDMKEDIGTFFSPYNLDADECAGLVNYRVFLDGAKPAPFNPKTSAFSTRYGNPWSWIGTDGRALSNIMMDEILKILSGEKNQAVINSLDGKTKFEISRENDNIVIKRNGVELDSIKIE
jgi:hypothetical protein